MSPSPTRKAIDDAVAGRPFDYGLLSELEGLANRGYTSGFLERHQTQDYQNYLTGHSIAKQSQYVGHVTEIDETAGQPSKSKTALQSAIHSKSSTRAATKPSNWNK